MYRQPFSNKLLILILLGNIIVNANSLEEQGYIHRIYSVGENILFTDNIGSGVYIYRNGKTEKLIDSRGAGYYYSLSYNGNNLGFKSINDNGQQQAAILNISTGNIQYLTDYDNHVGQPSFTSDGRIAYTLNSRLIINDGREYNLGFYSNIAPVSPNGKYACFNDDNDQLWLLDLDSSQRYLITDEIDGYYYPQWSENSRYILYLGFDSKIWIYDLDNNSNSFVAEGHEPRWSSDASQIVFYQKEIENFQLKNSDIYMIRPDGSDLRKLTDTENIFEIDPIFSEDGSQIIYHRLEKKEIVISNINQTKSALTSENIISVTISELKELTANYQTIMSAKSENDVLSVPYLHQVYDVPDWFWGYYACAPTTAAMLLAYYKILPKWEVRCSTPLSHYSYWGRYICERYYFQEIDYNYAASPNGYTAGKGGYGYMWSGSNRPSNHMDDYYRNHGITSSDQESTTWTKAVNNINAGNPYTMCVWLTSSGHLVLGKGVVEGKKTLIFNDPYGNKNTPGYPSYDGNGACYDWPGYNEGNVNLASAGSGIPWTIATSYSVLTRADTLVDDKHLENGFYLHTKSPSSMSKWKDKKSGYGGHHWYCDSRAGLDTDTCYAKWVPNLPSLGWYNVYVYIPTNANVVTNARYNIEHSDTNSIVAIDQSQYSGEWVNLGNYIFSSGTKGFVRLGDTCGETDKIVLFDAAKWMLDRPVKTNFVANRQTGAGPLTVKFTNQSDYLPDDCQILWDFGDGDVSNETEPLHIYRKSGDFTVQLTIIYPDTIQTMVKTDYIHIDTPIAGDFSLIVPEENSVLKTATPLFYWVPSQLTKDDIGKYIESIKISNSQSIISSIQSNINYQLYLHKNSDFTEVTPVLIDTNFYRSALPLDENQEYFWQIKYIASTDDTLESAIWSFSVDVQNSPPEVFTQIYPGKGETLINLSPVFTWNTTVDNDVNDSVFYRMKLGSDLHNFDIVYEGCNTSINLSDSLLDNHIYYWQVEAIDQAGAIRIAGDGESVFYTNCTNEEPNPVILLLPQNYDYVFTQYPVFSWLPADDPDPNDVIKYYMRYWPVGSTVRYVYPTDTTYCDIRRFKFDTEYYWYVEAEDSEGLTAISDTFLLRTSSTGIADIEKLPDKFALYQNSPNPFNPSTSIGFDLPEETFISLSVYDLTGRRVRALMNGIKPGGSYQITWDGHHDNGSPASAGVYIYLLQSEKKSISKKMLLLK